jgi:serine/threonine protein kinase
MVMKPGDLIDNRYELVSVLSKRGYRQKWIAQSTLTGERVILETLHDTVMSDEKALGSIRNEIALSQKLSGENFMHCLETFYFDNRLFLSWKYIDAQPLSSNPSLSRLTERDICRFIGLVVRALDFAHRRGIIHGALSTDNILITPTMTPIITGFPMPDQPIETDPGISHGISAYKAAAPELFDGSPFSEASDWYSVGVIARYMFHELRQAHQAQGLSPTALASLTARNQETLTARTTIESLSHRDEEVRTLSAAVICSPEFLDMLSTPAHGNPVVTVDKRNARKIKSRYRQSKKKVIADTSYLPVAGKVLIIVGSAMFILWLLSEIFLG